MENASRQYLTDPSHDSIDSTQHIPPNLGSATSPSLEQTSAPIETGSQDRGCSDLCDICGGLKRIEALLDKVKAPTALVRDIAKLKAPLCTTRDYIFMSLDSLEEFPQRLEAYIKQRCKSDSFSDVIYPVAQAVISWQEILDDLVSATDDLLMMTSSLNEHMTVLESADGIRRDDGATAGIPT